MDKSYLQGLAAHQLAKEHRLICMWCTGAGKSGVALTFLRDNPWMTCLILVPEQNNIQNWRDEFQKFQVDDSKVEILCYASLHKKQNTTWDFLVLDEVPHIDTKKRTALLQTICADYVLALGAVIDEEEQASLNSVYGYFPTSKISLEKAFDLGIIPPPTVHVFHLALDKDNKSIYHKGQRISVFDKYRLLQKKVDDAKEAYSNQPNKFRYMQMLRAGNERKKFLGEQKEEAIRRICAELQKKNRRFICFCASIEQANRLGGECAFTSKSPKNLQHLERFNNHEIDSLYVVGKLIEGQNLTDIECGVIGQLNGTERITVQEAGRVLRAKNPKIYIPIFDNTKDEDFLCNLTANISTNYIKHYKF